MTSRTRWLVPPGVSSLRLDKFLADPTRLGSRALAVTALDRGRVFVDGQEAMPAEASRRLETGQLVEHWADRPGSAHRHRGIVAFGALRIVYEDEALVVVDKPPGLLTVPLARRRDEASVQRLLEGRYASARHAHALVVHRIDRDTSGLVVFAKTPRAQVNLKRQFEERSVRRVYLALVHGIPEPRTGTWRDTLAWDAEERAQRAASGRHAHARDAVCRYAVLERFGHASLVEVELVTGKRNQIRVQASLRGHMLVGERQYMSDPLPTHEIVFSRQALHARRLELRHPLSGTPITVEADVPADLRRLLAGLRRRAR